MISNMARSTGVYLWVRPEIFEVGIIPTPPPPKLTHHNLRKLFAYAKNKGKVGYPNLSYSVWKHVACNKLQIDEQLAWIYFNTCEVLLENNMDNQIGLAQSLAAAKNKVEDVALREKRSVDLLKFILYLYIQHSHVISLKSPVCTGDEFPFRNRQQDLEGRAAIGTKGMDENAQTSFISTNITEVLDLLVEPESYGDESDMLITLDAVEKLSFLICATVDGRNILPLNEAACLQKEAQKSGFSKISSMFSCRRLQSWIKAYIRQNPFGISSCLSLGQKLRGRGYSCGDDSLNNSLSTSICEDPSSAPPTARPTYDWLDIQSQLLKDSDLSASFKSSQSNLVNRVITNANYSPESSKRIICNQVCKRTIARGADVLNNAIINIHRCQNSHLYLLSAMRAVIIEKCHNTTIVLGPVDTMVSVIACDNVNIIAVTKRINIVSSRDSIFQLCCQDKPVLIGRNKNLKFAPYYTFYASLQKDMSSVGIAPELNYWNHPVTLGLKKDALSSQIWELFPPEEFSKFIIPFDMEGSTKSSPMKIPKVYEDALQDRERRVEEWQKLVNKSELSRAQRHQLQSQVMVRFQDWLKDTGYGNLLESLAASVPPSAPR